MLRTVSLLAAAAGVLLAVALTVAAQVAPGVIAFLIWSAIAVVGLLIERFRYKRLETVAPGGDWRDTGERFIDPETGRAVAVFVEPGTGERRYVVAR